MATKEIPREQWVRFFDRFTKEHQRWVITLEITGSDLGAQKEVDGLPLLDISADLKDRENRILVIVGKENDRLTHIINGPKRVWHREPTEERAEEAIEVESESGTALVRFNHLPIQETERQLPAS